MERKVQRDVRIGMQEGEKMKELTVISGKGGTGKTTVTAALASLADNLVIADCDVDAPDLHLLIKPDILEKAPFYGMKLAKRDEDKCTSCGICLEHCRFDAIDDKYMIIPESCEGCGVCEYVCPTDAIEMVDRLSGYAYTSSTRFGPMSHAELNTAEEASGMLVTIVRNNAKKKAEEYGAEIIIIDGPPGTGCPVIASIVGVDLVLIVTEPTLSGISDLERVMEVCEHFDIPTVVCVNKHDINPDNTEDILSYCESKNVDMVGKLPYDDLATRAMIEEKTVIEYSDNILARDIRSIWIELKSRLEEAK